MRMTAVAGLFSLFLAAGVRGQGHVFAVVPTALNNLSPEPNSHGDSVAIVRLTQEARSRLATCGYRVISGDSMKAIESQNPSYLFEHPDAVAAWGAEHGAEWVLVGRLNRIGTWEADWEVRVISVPERRAVDMRSIELKGFAIDQSLTDQLATRGAAWIVDQATQSVAHASPGSSTTPRPCHA